ncbi:MAG: phosphate ABC transporter permease subunit PstC [Verrucomicrobiales bacterium]|nr:phosphate ABC transporter permease subunit PstC [Verrucomicrobiales bacterium]
MTSSKSTTLSRSLDRVFRGVLGLLAAVSGGMVLLIVSYLVTGAWPAIEAGRLAAFFTDERWQPGSARDPQFGVVSMLVGSLLVTLLAVGLATPVGVASAVFHRFYAPPVLERWNRRMLELLIGVPAVVFGFWGLMTVVPLIVRLAPETPGQSLLAGGIVLALMILPIVTLTTQAALQAVPRAQLLAAAGLGLGRARTIWAVALPAARGGIGAGVLLSLARAIGETMAVVLVCGNIPQIPDSLFDPIRPVTSTIALEMGYATASHKALLFCAGLVLVLFTAVFVGWHSFRRQMADTGTGGA